MRHMSRLSSAHVFYHRRTYIKGLYMRQCSNFTVTAYLWKRTSSQYHKIIQAGQYSSQYYGIVYCDVTRYTVTLAKAFLMSREVVRLGYLKQKDEGIVNHYRREHTYQHTWIQRGIQIQIHKQKHIRIGLLTPMKRNDAHDGNRATREKMLHRPNKRTLWSTLASIHQNMVFLDCK